MLRTFCTSQFTAVMALKYMSNTCHVMLPISPQLSLFPSQLPQRLQMFVVISVRCASFVTWNRKNILFSARRSSSNASEGCIITILQCSRTSFHVKICDIISDRIFDLLYGTSEFLTSCRVAQDTCNESDTRRTIFPLMFSLMIHSSLHSHNLFLLELDIVRWINESRASWSVIVEIHPCLVELCLLVVTDTIKYANLPCLQCS